MPKNRPYRQVIRLECDLNTGNADHKCKVGMATKGAMTPPLKVDAVWFHDTKIGFATVTPKGRLVMQPKGDGRWKCRLGVGASTNALECIDETDKW